MVCYFATNPRRPVRSCPHNHLYHAVTQDTCKITEDTFNEETADYYCSLLRVVPDTMMYLSKGIFFFHLNLFDGVSFQYFQEVVIFFSECETRQIFSWFSSSLHSIVSLFPFFIMSMVHFSIHYPISISWLYILIVFMTASCSFSFGINILITSIYLRWIVLSRDSINL